ncbi:MAG TPA: methyltransferase domain-containing protein [Dongiaceae bacterium]
MPSLAYTDPRLAACYDAINPLDASEPFYLALAGDAPKRVLDMGCGTGRLAIALAERGHRVTGADPSPGMLRVARSRPGGERVTWVDNAATNLSLETRFNLVIMTGHVFQVFLSDDDVRATLRALRTHLATGGTLAFETRNPLVEEWRAWIPLLTRETVAVPGIGAVEVHNDIAAAGGNLVTYETHFRFAPDDVAVTTDTLRFMSEAELAAFLAAAGFNRLTWFGDWNRSPTSPTSPEIIVLAG